MIRWTFFFEEGNINSDVKDEAEDMRIREFLSKQKLLHLPGDEIDIYVNPAMVKCTVRNPNPKPLAQEAQAASESAT